MAASWPRHAGYWSAKVAGQVADSIQQKWGLKKVRRRLCTEVIERRAGKR